MLKTCITQACLLREAHTALIRKGRVWMGETKATLLACLPSPKAGLSLSPYHWQLTRGTLEEARWMAEVCFWLRLWLSSPKVGLSPRASVASLLDALRLEGRIPYHTAPLLLKLFSLSCLRSFCRGSIKTLLLTQPGLSGLSPIAETFSQHTCRTPPAVLSCMRLPVHGQFRN